VRFPAPAYNGEMKPDIYTKAVLTVIAVALVAIASNQYTNPRTTVQAQASPFAGVQFTGGRTEFSAFDQRTGEWWVYSYVHKGAFGLVMAGKLTKLGQQEIPLSVEH